VRRGQDEQGDGDPENVHSETSRDGK
jgi:hypothetical protein